MKKNVAFFARARFSLENARHPAVAARVRAVATAADGTGSSTTIEYFLQKTDFGFRIVDVALEGASASRGLRHELHRYLSDSSKGYALWLSRMREKVGEPG